MKKILLISTLIVASLYSQARAEQHNGLGGLILGAGGGALFGQAVGRNTQSTVIGTAVGSVIGYVIGSEMDRHERRYEPVTYRNPRRVVEKRIVEYRHSYEPMQYRRDRGPRCKEAELLGTVHGRARTIHGTVCKTPEGWELVTPQDRGPGYSGWNKGHWKERRHGAKHGRQHWVERRF